MQEEWKDIPNFNGYQVSNKGRVRTHNKITYTEIHGERHWKDRILKYKGNSYKTGYRVDLWKNGKPYTMLVARLVAFTFYEKDINNHDLTVNHIDGNRFNNNISNLELISLADNIRHAFDTGLNSSSKYVKVIYKNGGYVLLCRSMTEASKLMNKSHDYISSKVKKGIYEDNCFKWELL